MSASRYFENVNSDYVVGKEVSINKKSVIQLINQYVNKILINTHPKSGRLHLKDRRPDIYVGDSGKQLKRLNAL